MRRYDVWTSPTEVLIRFELDDGQILKLSMSHDQAAALAARLREALAMGPQVPTPN
jgi:hypothetical protein